jgi:hypothetical protein
MNGLACFEQEPLPGKKTERTKRYRSFGRWRNLASQDSRRAIVWLQ